MELKPYQQTVINELAEFIGWLEKTEQINLAYERYWNSKGISFFDLEGKSIT
jgi:hypothetical protein